MLLIGARPSPSLWKGMYPPPPFGAEEGCAAYGLTLSPVDLRRDVVWGGWAYHGDVPSPFSYPSPWVPPVVLGPFGRDLGGLHF